jgi:HSP20 family molecular chaperone IbpA
VLPGDIQRYAAKRRRAVAAATVNRELSFLRRVFNLADHVQGKEASFRNGLLIVDLVREVPESMKPRRIAIGGTRFSEQIEQKKAA